MPRKTLKDLVQPQLLIEIEVGEKLPHTKKGFFVGYRRRVDHVVKLHDDKTLKEVPEILARLVSIAECQMYCHWILTNPNGFYELKDLALFPERKESIPIFIVAVAPNVYAVHTEETLPKNLPEKKEEVHVPSQEEVQEEIDQETIKSILDQVRSEPTLTTKLELETVNKTLLNKLISSKMP